MPKSLVYYFGGGHADGGKDDKLLLGGKGANLAEMTRIGIPVPPGFTITTENCKLYLSQGGYAQGLKEQVADAIKRLEKDTGKVFGGSENPLLVSVRSGAPASMPGMMDTILNLGLNDRTVQVLAKNSGNERFAWDSYRRFAQMYGDVVLLVPPTKHEKLLDEYKEKRGVAADTGLTTEDLKELVREFKALAQANTGKPFPEEPVEQLWGAVEAVFRSWNNERAIAYRRVNRIPESWGTAVNVQAMAYGNMGDDSGTGVAFTRNPATGENKFFGEFLVNAQGEDVVAGIRTPLHIDEMAGALPAAYQELLKQQNVLERHYRDMQDLEFTVERGRLYILQTRNGKRTAQASVRIAAEMVDEGLITEQEAVLRVDPKQVDQLLHPRLDPNAKATVIGKGLPASPGAAAGKVVFDPAKAVAMSELGEAVILVRRETSPDDFSGMVAAKAIVTARGGMTSHAAVVARGMGKCCVAGATDLVVEEDEGVVRYEGGELHEGDWITVDGGAGVVYAGKVATVAPELSTQFKRIMDWADKFRQLGVRTNADTPADAAKAREFGAEGIGLTRTEHMFFEGNRIQAMREMILAENVEERKVALAKLLPMQRADFLGIFKAMDGLPVTIRLLDPPLHEFLPHPDEVDSYSKAAGVDPVLVRRAIDKHHEANPMLGHRGCRLGMTFPEITEMQAQAIFEAAIEATKEGATVFPEVMVPLIADIRELERQTALIHKVADTVQKKAGRKLDYKVGTMIELPRAALTAGQIAKEAQFFSFGTNDLTQTTYGLSRDDAGKFLPFYVEQGIFPDDPFQTLDPIGVGRLIEIATREGRATRPDLKVGICGEHGGDPRSVEFCHEVGLNYVSCSPFRVPIARLAAAQAALKGPKGARLAVASETPEVATAGAAGIPLGE